MCIRDSAYGHGIFEVARILGESGVEWMAVATYSEARLALLAAPQAKVLILGYTPLDMMDEICLLYTSIVLTAFTKLIS